MSNYRIEDKGNVYINGSPMTSYKVYTLDSECRGYVYRGNGFAPKHDRTDGQCWADWRYRETIDASEEDAA